MPGRTQLDGGRRLWRVLPGLSLAATLAGCSAVDLGFVVSMGIADQEFELSSTVLPETDWAGVPAVTLNDGWNPELGALHAPLTSSDGRIVIEGGLELVGTTAYGEFISSATRVVSEAPLATFRPNYFLRESAEPPSVPLFEALASINVRVDTASCAGPDPEYGAEVSGEGFEGEQLSVTMVEGVGWRFVNVETGGTDLVAGLVIGVAVFPGEGCP